MSKRNGRAAKATRRKARAAPRPVQTAGEMLDAVHWAMEQIRVSTTAPEGTAETYLAIARGAMEQSGEPVPQCWESAAAFYAAHPGGGPA